MPLPLFIRRDRTTGADVSSAGRNEWDGSALDQDWNTAANWSAGTVPVSGDNVQLCTSAINQLPTLNLSHPTVRLAALRFGQQQGGPSSTPDEDAISLTIDADDVHIDRQFGTVTLDGNYENVYIYETDPAVTAVSLSGDITSLYILGASGGIKIENSTNLDNIYLTPANSKPIHLTLGTSVQTHVVSANGTGPAKHRIRDGGFITSGSGCIDLDISGRAEIHFTGDSSDAMNDVVIGRRAQVRNDSSGRMTEVTLYPGSRYTIRDNEDETLTLIDATVYADSRLELNSGLSAVSVSSGIVSHGGAVLIDQEQTLGVA